MSAKEKRTEQLKIMLTPSEMEDIESRADDKTLPKSTFARSKLMDSLGEA